MKRKIVYLSFIAPFLALIVVSCSENSNDPTPQRLDPVITEVGKPVGTASSSSIGPQGGFLHSDDGKLTVSIPADALTAATTISIQPITNEGPLGVGLAYRLQPEGVTFKKPVTLTFHYDDNQVAGIPADFFWIITQAGNGSWNAMLKSVVDLGHKTVSTETTHFSDWALGRFINLALEPSASTIQKGSSVELRVAGFVRDQAIPEDEELAPLVPITGDGEGLTPLTPIPPIESRLMDFKVKQWTLNGLGAPISNSNGSLNATKNKATYKAPNTKPSTNPVAVSVTLESNNKEGRKSSYMLTSSISVVDSDLYLLLKVDGQTYEYFQYGINGAIPPDPNNMWMTSCSQDDDTFVIGAGLYTPSEVKLVFVFQADNVFEGTKVLNCFNNGGYDDMEFLPVVGGESFNLRYVERTPTDNNRCELESRCSDMALTLVTYKNEANSIVTGYFSGKLYYDPDDYHDQCKTSVAHTVEGEFRLVLLK